MKGRMQRLASRLYVSPSPAWIFVAAIRIIASSAPVVLQAIANCIFQIVSHSRLPQEEQMYCYYFSPSTRELSLIFLQWCLWQALVLRSSVCSSSRCLLVLRKRWFPHHCLSKWLRIVAVCQLGQSIGSSPNSGRSGKGRPTHVGTARRTTPSSSSGCQNHCQSPCHRWSSFMPHQMHQHPKRPMI